MGTSVDQIWSQLPPIGLPGLDSWSPLTLTWYWVPSLTFSNMYRLNTRAGVLPRSASSHFSKSWSKTSISLWIKTPIKTAQSLTCWSKNQINAFSVLIQAGTGTSCCGVKVEVCELSFWNKKICSFYFSNNTPPGAKLGLCRRTIYSKLSTSDHNLFQIFLWESKFFFEPRQIFYFFPNYPPPHHNLGQILNSDLASSYFPLKCSSAEAQFGTGRGIITDIS